MPAANLADLRLVMGAGAIPVIGNSVLQVIYFHPAAEQVSDLFISGILYPVR
ncbi:hypothetical protein D3C73_1549300 [compost metagenome]